MPIQVTLPLSRRDLLALGLSEKKIAAEMTRELILKLYRNGQISSGKAAEILGIHKQDFVSLLAANKIPFFNYTEEELEEEHKAVTQILKEKDKR